MIRLVGSATGRVGTGRSWLAFAVAATFAALAVARNHLPNPAAVHWGSSGTPNKAASLWTVAIVTAVVVLAISAAIWRVHPRGQRAVHGFMATLVLLLQTVTIWANWGRRHWQDARSVHLPVLLVLILLPIGVSYLAANYGEPATDGEPATAGAKRRRVGGLGPVLALVVGVVLLIQLGGAAGGALAAALVPVAVVAVFLAAASRKSRVDITTDEHSLTVTMLGMEALLCMRRVVSAPLASVRSIDVVDRADLPHPGMRMPGTSLPGVITAGSYGFGDARSFWDIRRGRTLLRIELDPQQAEYCRIVLEVGDPAAVATQLRSKLATAHAPLT